MIYEQYFLTACIDQIGVYVSFGGAFFFPVLVLQLDIADFF